MLFFNFLHPGDPGQLQAISQITVSPELLKRMHEMLGRAVEHLGLDDGAEAINVDELPENVRPLFPPKQ